jgi:hypothetical protein
MRAGFVVATTERVENAVPLGRVATVRTCEQAGLDIGRERAPAGRSVPAAASP